MAIQSRMKIAFSIRGINAYPYRWPGPAPVEARRRFFSFARDLGAEGVEVEDTWLPFAEMSDAELSELREEAASFGLSIAALKLGRNNLCLPDERDRNLERTLRALEIASILKTEIVTSSLTGGKTVSDPNKVIFQLGSARSVGSSREASQEDYEQTAVRLQQVADAAAEKGLKFALEIHQGSIADNSKATLRLLEMVGRPNVGINPDLGNILWSYNIPEESWADTIQNTAGRMIFWHIKNMRRVYLPEPIGRCSSGPTCRMARSTIATRSKRPTRPDSPATSASRATWARWATTSTTRRSASDTCARSSRVWSAAGRAESPGLFGRSLA